MIAASRRQACGVLSSHLLDPRAERLRPRGAVQQGQDRADWAPWVELGQPVVLGAGHPILVEASGTDGRGHCRGIGGGAAGRADGHGAWRVVAIAMCAPKRPSASSRRRGRLNHAWRTLQPSPRGGYKRYTQEARHCRLIQSRARREGSPFTGNGIGVRQGICRSPQQRRA